MLDRSRVHVCVCIFSSRRTCRVTSRRGHATHYASMAPKSKSTTYRINTSDGTKFVFLNMKDGVPTVFTTGGNKVERALLEQGRVGWETLTTTRLANHLRNSTEKNFARERAYKRSQKLLADKQHKADEKALKTKERRLAGETAKLNKQEDKKQARHLETLVKAMVDKLMAKTKHTKAMKTTTAKAMKTVAKTKHKKVMKTTAKTTTAAE